MNAVSPPLPTDFLTDAEVQASAAARAHPAFQAAIVAALASRFPGDVMLAVADAVAELLPYLPEDGASGELPARYRATMLAEALHLAARRLDAAVPRLPTCPATMDPGLPDGCQGATLASAAQAAEGTLGVSLGQHQARSIVAAAETAAAGDLWRVVRPAELAIAFSNAGLGAREMAQLHAAISASPAMRTLRGGTVLRLLHDARACLA